MKGLGGAIVIIGAISVFLAIYFLNYDNNSKQNIPMSELKITSPAFPHNGNIPAKYTCDGGNTNSPLEISGAPEGTKSLALVMDDPDATGGRTWDHWLFWNLSPDATRIEEGVEPEAVFGATSFGDQKYGGPCPPHGSGAHRYFFKLYALDAILDLPAGTGKGELEKAMEGHILGQVELIGLYKRK